ncbi:MAG TPA: EamA family transporter RarD [Rectinemataceae bacterium]|nr:EamA family transporter RarD [Rectinemataceae bacterium]
MDKPGGLLSSSNTAFLQSKGGTIAAFATYGMWGLFPLYWKRLEAIDPFQVLSHRIVWAALFTVFLLAFRGGFSGLLSLLANRKRLAVAFVAALLVTTNWGVYIWAVDNGNIAQSALGYYINPLVSVALGALFLREKLDGFTMAAIGIAAAGVIAATIILGSPPWISLILAFTFGFYGLVKKQAGLDPMTGLAAETLTVTPIALAYLIWRHSAGAGAFGGPDVGANILLVVAGPVTAIPLITFAFAANRITLQRLGFIQYVSPSMQLILGLFVYREELTPALIVAFVAVIGAVLIYAGSRGRFGSR